MSEETATKYVGEHNGTGPVRVFVGGFLVWLGFRVIGMRADGWTVTKADGSTMKWDMRAKPEQGDGR